MASRHPSLDDVALQLERATAQLRILSARPQLKHEGDIREAITNIQDQIHVVQNSVDGLYTDVGALVTDVGALRGRTNDRLTVLEAAVHNDKMRLNNGTVKNPNSELMGLRDTKINEKISGFPKTAAEFRHLKEPDADRIAVALGWNLSGANILTKQDFLLKQAGFGGLAL